VTSSRQPKLCLIHEAIGQDSAIAKIALNQVRAALAAGWSVSVVAKILDPSVREKVTWLPLKVPRRLFLYKWITARHFIRRALGGRTFDVIHAHQPQVADLSDVFQCHFLTRVAYERKCLEERPGLRPKLIRVQQQGVLYAEDRCYRRWNPNTRMLFCSDLLRREFARLYGPPPLEEVLVNPCPPINFASVDERQAARRALVGEFSGLVIGYIGGLQERKGYKRLMPAIEADPNLFLLMAGAYTDRFVAPALSGRFKGIGLTSDVSTFYAACDVLVVPSLFEPLGLVAFEAAARGTPVIATREVGALPHLLEFGAGVEWNPTEPLGDLARNVMSNIQVMRAGAVRMASEISETRQAERLMAVYEQVLRNKKDGTPRRQDAKDEPGMKGTP
jgi:glycosyltransferase involved in cell wall biosynthesis